MNFLPSFTDSSHDGSGRRSAFVRSGQTGAGDETPVSEPKSVLVVGCGGEVHAALTASGWHVVSAASGDEGSTYARKTQVDDLIINYHLADVRGDVLYTLAMAYQPHLRTHTIFLVRDTGSPAARALGEFGCPILQIDSDPSEVLKVLAGME